MTRAGKKITLYHFTSGLHLGKILTSGALSIGDVPTGPTTGYNALWFTEEPNINTSACMLASNVDKTTIRITVQLDKATPRLHYWRDVAPKIGVSSKLYRALDRTANYTARYWWIYAGAIPAAMFKAVDHRQQRTSPYIPLDIDSDMVRQWVKEADKWQQIFLTENIQYQPFPDI
jgi:hypothetical protein